MHTSGIDHESFTEQVAFLNSPAASHDSQSFQNRRTISQACDQAPAVVGRVVVRLSFNIKRESPLSLLRPAADIAGRL
jgi:hypothetical protein